MLSPWEGQEGGWTAGEQRVGGSLPLYPLYFLNVECICTDFQMNKTGNIFIYKKTIMRYVYVQRGQMKLEATGSHPHQHLVATCLLSELPKPPLCPQGLL
jgi:hypothetical protein